MESDVNNRNYERTKRMQEHMQINHIPSKLHLVDVEKEEWYMATMTPGLESVAADEIKSKLPGSVLIERMRGKVFFAVADGFDYHQLRSIDNIYLFAYAGSIGMTRNDFPAFRNELTSVAFRRTLQYVQDRLRFAHGFTSNASKVGKHSFSRFEIANHFDAAMQDFYHLQKAPCTGIEGILEFRIDVIEKHFLISVKLTDAAFRFRGTDRLFSKAAIRPTVAHALVWLAKPFDDEIFADPFCGSGTILCERAAYPYAQLIGNDYNQAELGNARANLGHKASLYNRNAAELFFDNQSIDTVITNPPWGKQIQVDDAFALYSSFLGRFSKYIKKTGKLIVLTNLEQVLMQAAAQSALSCDKLLTISLHGTLCAVYTLQG